MLCKIVETFTNLCLKRVTAVTWSGGAMCVGRLKHNSDIYTLVKVREVEMQCSNCNHNETKRETKTVFIQSWPSAESSLVILKCKLSN